MAKKKRGGGVISQPKGTRADNIRDFERTSSTGRKKGAVSSPTFGKGRKEGGKEHRLTTQSEKRGGQPYVKGREKSITFEREH